MNLTIIGVVTKYKFLVMLTCPQTSVAVASWAAYQSSANFRNPDHFLPERWLKNTQEGYNDNKGVMQPFSVGPRGCPGKR